MILLGSPITIGTLPFPKLKFGAHLLRLKINTIQVYYLTVYFSTELCSLKNMRAVPSTVLQNIERWGKILMMKI